MSNPSEGNRLKTYALERPIMLGGGTPILVDFTNRVVGIYDKQGFLVETVPMREHGEDA